MQESAGVDPSVLSSQALGSSSLEQQEQSFKQSTEEALKSSINKTEKGAQLDQNKALEQLNLLKEAAPTDATKNALTQLDTLIRQDHPNQLANIQHLQSLVETAFSSTVMAADVLEDVQVSLNNLGSQNPFKPDNPFAPRVISSTKSKFADNHDRQEEEAPKEEKQPQTKKKFSFKNLLRGSK